MTGQELKVELDKLRPQIKDIKQQINDSSDDTKTEDLNGHRDSKQTKFQRKDGATVIERQHYVDYVVEGDRGQPWPYHSLC